MTSDKKSGSAVWDVLWARNPAVTREDLHKLLQEEQGPVWRAIRSVMTGHSSLGCFDVAMSFRLAEHFQGDERTAIHKSHFALLKESGTAIIAVPNAQCLP